MERFQQWRKNCKKMGGRENAFNINNTIQNTLKYLLTAVKREQFLFKTSQIFSGTATPRTCVKMPEPVMSYCSGMIRSEGGSLLSGSFSH